MFLECSLNVPRTFLECSSEIPWKLHLQPYFWQGKCAWGCVAVWLTQTQNTQDCWFGYGCPSDNVKFPKIWSFWCVWGVSQWHLIIPVVKITSSVFLSLLIFLKGTWGELKQKATRVQKGFRNVRLRSFRYECLSDKKRKKFNKKRWRHIASVTSYFRDFVLSDGHPYVNR
jgi:hypothetical protein